MTFKVNVKIYHILIIQFETVSQLTETVKVLLRIAQYDLVESIKNTNTEDCSDDLSSDRLSSFKCTVRVFIFLSDTFALPFFPSNVMFVYSIWRGATKSIKYLVSFLSGFRPSMNCSLH